MKTAGRFPADVGDADRGRRARRPGTAPGTLYAREFERDGRAFAVCVSGPLAFNEPELMLAAALDNLGVAHLLDHEVASHLEKGTLVRLLPDWTPSFPGFHLYYSSKRQMRPILAAFMDAVGRPMR